MTRRRWRLNRALAHKPRVQALSPVESDQSAIAIYRPRKCFTPKYCCTLNAQVHLLLDWAPNQVGDACRAVEHVDTTAEFKAVFSYRHKGVLFCASISGKVDAHNAVLSSTHTSTRQGINITKLLDSQLHQAGYHHNDSSQRFS